MGSGFSRTTIGTRIHFRDVTSLASRRSRWFVWFSRVFFFILGLLNYDDFELLPINFLFVCEHNEIKNASMFDQQTWDWNDYLLLGQSSCKGHCRRPRSGDPKLRRRWHRKRPDFGSQRDAVICVHVQQSNGGTADIRKADNQCAMQSKVGVPSVTTRMEERNEITCFGVDRSDVWTLVGVASLACQREV
jgi:hypothetical protein